MHPFSFSGKDGDTDVKIDQDYSKILFIALMELSLSKFYQLSTFSVKGTQCSLIERKYFFLSKQVSVFWLTCFLTPQNCYFCLKKK